MSYKVRLLQAKLYWVSLIALIVSMVFLLAGFFTYCALPKLRSIAGINNMMLIFALFWVQLFLLIGTSLPLSGWLCQVVGVATHYFWLLVALSENACAFHMFYTLAFPLQSHSALASPRKMTRRYVIFVFSISASIVVGVLCWQFAAHGRSDYGGRFCYITTAVV
jgi:hypothetical protein